jgi:hypothetical protein
MMYEISVCTLHSAVPATKNTSKSIGVVWEDSGCVLWQL